MAAILLVGCFSAAIWYLRRDGSAGGERRGLGIQGVLRAIRKRQRVRLAEREQRAATAAATTQSESGDGSRPDSRIDIRDGGMHATPTRVVDRRGGWGLL